METKRISGRAVMVHIEYRLPSDYMSVRQAAERLANETGKLVEVSYRPKRTGVVEDIRYHMPGREKGRKRLERLGGLAAGNRQPRLSPLQKRLKRLLLGKPPRTRKELARIMGCSETTLQTYFFKLSAKGVRVVCLYDRGRSRYTILGKEV